jgi:uncharacterized membrane protein
VTRRYGWLIGVLVGILLAPVALPGQSGPVRAVLFYSPTCPHCHTVIRDVLPRVFAQFGGEPQFHQGAAAHLLSNGQLEVLLVDGSHPDGFALYQSSTEALRIPPDRIGVPRLVCGDSVLVGSEEIPAYFPDLVSRGLAAGGIGWPAVGGDLASVFPPGYAAAPALPPSAPRDTATGKVGSDSARGAIAEEPRPAEPATTDAVTRTPNPTPEPAAAPPAPRTETSGTPAESAAPAPVPAVVPPEVLAPRAESGGTLVRTLRADPVGGSLALALLGGMIACLAWAPRRSRPLASRAATVAVPLLVAAGVAIAGYLGYVEASGAAAVCGPVGDCNAVQHSPYARPLGVPVALVGLGGYLLVLAAWLAARRAGGPSRARAFGLAFLLAVGGTLASVVLTFLEPFVIGAVCAWCLGSAVVMTALMWVLAGQAREARAAPVARHEAAARPSAA